VCVFAGVYVCMMCVCVCVCCLHDMALADAS